MRVATLTTCNENMCGVETGDHKGRPYNRFVGVYFRSNRTCRLSPTPPIMKMGLGDSRIAPTRGLPGVIFRGMTGRRDRIVATSPFCLPPSASRGKTQPHPISPPAGERHREGGSPQFNSRSLFAYSHASRFDKQEHIYQNTHRRPTAQLYNNEENGTKWHQMARFSKNFLSLTGARHSPSVLRSIATRIRPTLQ